MNKFFTLESTALRVDVISKGAELQSVFNKNQQLEYLWQGDPAFWGKRSPVLFPIVGTLKDNSFRYNGKSYSLNRHGFAREMDFDMIEQSEGKLVFALSDNDETKKLFPFSFRFQVEYTLSGTTLSVTYRVLNTSETETCWFSVGAHPAFRVPLTDDTVYEDYYLEFEKPETIGRWLIVSGGLIATETEPLLDNEKKLPLTRDLFVRDAVVLKGLKSEKMRLASDKNNLGFEFSYTGFPFMGIWAAPGADFVCIEPWCGIADSIDSSGKIEEKEGIRELEAGGEFVRTWSVQF